MADITIVSDQTILNAFEFFWALEGTPVEKSLRNEVLDVKCGNEQPWLAHSLEVKVRHYMDFGVLLVGEYYFCFTPKSTLVRYFKDISIRRPGTLRRISWENESKHHIKLADYFSDSWDDNTLWD